jgi:hypothetical protein
MIRIIAKAGLAGGLSAILTLDYLRFARYTDKWNGYSSLLVEGLWPLR